MSDRINALTVVLEKDMKDEDVRQVVQAIKMIKNVLKVKTNIVDINSYCAEQRVRAELHKSLFAVLYNEEDKEL